MTPLVQVKVQEKRFLTVSIAQLVEPSSDVLILGQSAPAGFFTQVRASLNSPPGRHFLNIGPERGWAQRCILTGNGKLGEFENNYEKVKKLFPDMKCWQLEVDPWKRGKRMLTEPLLVYSGAHTRYRSTLANAVLSFLGTSVPESVFSCHLPPSTSGKTQISASIEPFRNNQKQPPPTIGN